MQRINTLNLPTFIGFNRLFDEMDRVFENSNKGGYPPYNVIRTNDNVFGIEVAVAGFGMDDLDIIKDGNILRISGNSQESESTVEYVHRGIGGRAFTREFTIADHVEVIDATLDNGILKVNLERIVPEALQPKKIAITSNTKAIENNAVLENAETVTIDEPEKETVVSK